MGIYRQALMQKQANGMMAPSFYAGAMSMGPEAYRQNPSQSTPRQPQPRPAPKPAAPSTAPKKLADGPGPLSRRPSPPPSRSSTPIGTSPQATQLLWQATDKLASDPAGAELLGAILRALR